ncbi:hypothetical protein Droror1_Dr00015096 [Drosera rotundifolia]
MENNHKQANTSSEVNPILKTPTLINGVDDYEFEFNCITTSSSFWDPYQDSPADRFFLNGKLQPHSFPWSSSDGGSGATSRTSSVSSKDSLMWSRSNSVNSKSSRCSSARTGADDHVVIENKSGNDKNTLKGLKRQDLCKYKLGCSKRWQLIISAPALDPFVPRRRNTKSAECLIQGKIMSPEKITGDEGEEKGSNEKLRVWRRMLRSIVAKCKACHAMEYRSVDDDFPGKRMLE